MGCETGALSMSHVSHYTNGLILENFFLRIFTSEMRLKIMPSYVPMDVRKKGLDRKGGYQVIV